jgi:peptidoglycan/LPS O-acetylase OafA/YrhL
MPGSEIGAGVADAGGAIARPAKLPSLDTGRFVAALLVALFHHSFTIFNLTGAKPLGMLFRGGHSGVDYFFVLSGFIILYVHRADLGRPARLAGFAEKRVIRIVPMLWLVMIPWGLLKLVHPDGGTNGPVTPLHFLLDLLLLPHPGAMVLGVTWTLRQEALFYLLFATAILHRRIGIALLVAWQVLVLVYAVHPFPFGIDPGMGFGIFNLGFGIGMAAALIVPACPLGNGRAALLFGAALYVTLMAVEWLADGPMDIDYHPLGPTLTPILYMVAALALLAGMVSGDIARPRPPNRVTETLGGASYLLYLVHPVFGSLFIRIFRGFSIGAPPALVLAALTLGSIAAAVLLHLFVEKPVLAWLRRRASDRTTRKAAALAAAPVQPA